MRTAVPILTVVAVTAGLIIVGLVGSLEPMSVTLLVIMVIFGSALHASRRTEPAPPPETDAATEHDPPDPEHVSPEPDTDAERVPLVPPPPPGRADPGAALIRMAVAGGIVVTLALGTAVSSRNHFADTTFYGSPESSYQPVPDYSSIGSPDYRVRVQGNPYPFDEPSPDVDALLGRSPSVLLNGEPGESAEVQIMGLSDSCPATCGEVDARLVAYTIRIRNTGTVPVTPWPGVDGWAEDALGDMHLAEQAEGLAYPPIAPRAEAFRVVEVQVPPASFLPWFHIGLRLGGSNRIATLDSPGN